VDEDPQAPARQALTMRQAIAWMVLDFRMTRTSLLIVTAALLEATALNGVARAQAYLPEDNLAYPVQVVVAGGGGTGFFVRRERELFLVTARHVLFDVLTGRLHTNELTLRALSKDVHEKAVTVIHVNAAQLVETKQIREDAPRDVAVIRLAMLRSDGLDTTPGVVVTEKARGAIVVAPFDYLTKYADVDISSQIFMFGYPSVGVSGFSQIDGTKPLVRGGIVAGLNPELKTIIIDAPVNHGNSGGPVVQLSRTNRLRIIGIATQFVPVPEDVLPLRPEEALAPGSASRPMLALGNSGYGVVASADAIIELISVF
jgi:S1-C subfamily serine protease